jgi:RNA polymerase sporulation-specific sigma factor
MISLTYQHYWEGLSLALRVINRVINQVQTEKCVFDDMRDEEIIMLASNGNSRAVDFIISKYVNLVRSKARPYFLIGADREDIIQEGMIGLFKAVRDFRTDRYSSFRAFAEVCISRQIITAIKSATRQKHIPLNSYVSLNKPVFDDENDRTLLDMIDEKLSLDPEQLYINREQFTSIEEKIYRVLSNLEKRVLKLYLEGKSYIEIADKLGKSMKSIDNALQRVKRKLEKSVEESE